MPQKRYPDSAGSDTQAAAPRVKCSNFEGCCGASLASSSVVGCGDCLSPPFGVVSFPSSSSFLFLFLFSIMCYAISVFVFVSLFSSPLVFNCLLAFGSGLRAQSCSPC